MNGYCTRNNGNQCRVDRDCPSNERCSYGSCVYSGSNVRAECETRGIRIKIGPVSLSFKEETWLEERNSSDVRVDSCSCSNGNLRVDEGATTRTIGCSRCEVSGSTYTCLQ